MTVEMPSSSSEPRISVSVVTYNNMHCLPAFLDAVRRQADVSWELFLFDNASQDGTAALIRKAAMGEIFVSDTNVGHGRAHNYSAARCRAAYLLILNPDLEFGPDLFAGLVHHLDSHPEQAVAGPLILEGQSKRPFPPRRFYPGEGLVALEPGLRRRHIAWLNGCCFIIRRDVFLKLGGFDPAYFLYQDDIDLCLRARRAGYPIGYAEETVVHHLHRQSQRDLSEYDCARRVFQGSALFWEKHYRPRDVPTMVRFQYWMSRILLGLEKLRSRVPGLQGVLSKDRLRARRDVCDEWLKNNGRRRIALSGLLVTIALRQCRLAVEWMLQGKFPLDDY